MKKLSIILFAVALYLFSIKANAQIRFGVKGAINFNNYKTKELSLDNKTGWQAGVMARFKLPIVGLGIQPELLFTQRAAELEDGSSTRTSYLQVPVNALWTFGLGNAGVFITAGPYFSYAVDFGKGFNSETLDRFDWGLGLGGGLDFGKLHAGIRYDWGLQNIAKADGAKLKNNAFSIFAGLFF